MNFTKFRTEFNEERVVTLVKECNVKYVATLKEATFDNPEKVHKLMCTAFGIDNLTEEYVYIIGLDTLLHPTGIFELSHGNDCGSIIDAKAVYIRLLLSNSRRFIVVHNHPSGAVKPSKEDIQTTIKLAEGGKLLDIKLLDHVIIGKYKTSEYYSLKENGHF